jgi:hypothetical protein
VINKMTVQTGTFNFVEAYRHMQPNATREIVSAREAAYVALRTDLSIAQILDLCRLAYRMHVPTERGLEDWFAAVVRKTDPQFSMTIDSVEAGRIAALLLTDRVKQQHLVTTVAVLTTSFSGKRESVDHDELSILAGVCLAAEARRRRVGTPPAELLYPTRTDRSTVLTQIETSFGHASVKTALEALAADAHGQGAELANTITTILKTAHTENMRLAEEIDLLWWHIGGWSELLERPLALLPKRYLPIVVGADLACMIRALPGPYGANAILRRALGPDADARQSLAEVVTTMDVEDLARIIPSPPAGCSDILALHSAGRAVVEHGKKALGDSFERTTGISQNAEMTCYELALQTFRERMLMLHGWTE